MPYLTPGSPGFLTADEIIRQRAMSRAGQEYYDQLARNATTARDEAMRTWQQRQADLYMQQHHPQFAIPGSTVNTPFETRRRRGQHVRGGDYYAAPSGYTPTVVAQGAAAPPIVPSNMSVIAPEPGGFTGPRSIEELRADQLKTGNAPVPLPMPGYVPTRQGYFYAGTREGFENELAYRNMLLSQGIPSTEMEAYGAPSETD